MKRFYFFCALLLLLFSAEATAQFYRGGRTLEYSSLFKRYYYREPFNLQVGVGQAFVSGDYCSRLTCVDPGRYISVSGFANIQPGISVGAELDYFLLGAMEEEADETDGGRISFEGKNMALNGIVKINLRRDESSQIGQATAQSPVWMPYLRLGVGGLLYRPVSYRIGQPYDTRHPQEARQQYPGIALNFPLGAGISFQFLYRLRINAEFTYHFTNTDYLDDMGAVPGTPVTYDRYSIAAIKVQYAF